MEFYPSMLLFFRNLPTTSRKFKMTRYGLHLTQDTYNFDVAVCHKSIKLSMYCTTICKRVLKNFCLFSVIIITNQEGKNGERKEREKAAPA